MGLFKNSEASYQHSQFIKDLVYQYDSFLDSLEVIADFGCGEGLDVEWWATLETRDEPPEPRNYLCYAVDKNITTMQANASAVERASMQTTLFDNALSLATIQGGKFTEVLNNASNTFAGVLAAPVFQVNPIMGSNLIIVVFAVVVIGGMGSIMGSIVTGVSLGLLEGLTKVFYPEGSGVVIFVVMAIVLLLRPAGLFGKEK